MRFYIPDYEIYRTDREEVHKGGTAIAVNKGIPHTCADLLPLCSVEATRVCISTGDIEMLASAVYTSPRRLWIDTDISELFRFSK
jgi:hypothetical protein